MKKGVLYGVGVGPGDPELLTLKAVRCLTHCPVVAYPAPPHGKSLARSIAAPYLDPPDSHAKTEIAIRIPLTQEDFTAPEIYANARRDLAAHLDQGRDVAVLCLGDPLLYGSFIYLLQGFPSCYAIRVIPGVSAVTAAASAALAPLAVREETLSIIPATLDEDPLAQRIAHSQAAVFIKVGHHLGKLQKILARLGLDKNALYIERASFDDEKRLPLEKADPNHASYFSVVLARKRSLP